MVDFKREVFTLRAELPVRQGYMLENSRHRRYNVIGRRKSQGLERREGRRGSVTTVERWQTDVLFLDSSYPGIRLLLARL